jgi:hypothetical protein
MTELIFDSKNAILLERPRQPVVIQDCELVERVLSVMYITVSVRSNYIMCMFWEGEKRRAPGPTDNIHKMPS